MTSPKSFRALLGVQNSTVSSTSPNSALIIIDAQNEYATGHLKTVNVVTTRKAIAGLLERYRSGGAGEQKGKVVHVLHETSAEAPVFTTGKEVEKEFEELGVKGDEKVIRKQYPGAFAGTDLHQHLQSMGVKQVVLTGYMAHVCVSTTARQASELGYDVVLVADAIGDRDIPGIGGEELTKVVLLELSDAFGTVLNSNAIQ